MIFMKNTTQHGNTGKKNARIDSNEGATEQIKIRVKPSDKKNWKNKAEEKKTSLSRWIIAKLNT